MNAITAGGGPPHTQGMSDATVEQVLGTGNLAALSPKQRVELMLAVCRSRGLNPLTRPFRFMTFQGQVVLYATRDCADQLRKIDGINVEIVSKGIEDDLYVVEVRATDKHGRRDSDLGAVVIANLRGEARANAMLKAMTKAKRRVTLSICGLGILDETEVHDMKGAVLLEDSVIETPETAPAPEPAAGAPPERPQYPFATGKGGTIFHTASEFTERWRTLISDCVRRNALDKLAVAWAMNAAQLAAVAEHDPDAAAEVREMVEEHLDAATEAEEPTVDPIELELPY